MSLNDPLANVLSKIQNAESMGKSECVVAPKTKIAMSILNIMQNKRYIGNIEVIEDSKGDYMKISLIGNLNRCGVIKPRFSVTKDEFEKFEKRYLPSKNVGFIAISTSQGIMTHSEAKEKKIGGKLISYCY